MTVDEYETFINSVYSYYIQDVIFATELYRFKYMSAKDINLNYEIVQWDIHNKYLMSIIDKKDELTESILDNGMYFPFVIDSDGYIMEGLHRVMMLQLADIDYKYLALIMDEKKFDRVGDITPKWDKPKLIYMPTERMLQLKSSDELTAGFESGEFKLLNDFKMMEVWTNDKMMFGDYLVQFGCWLRDPIFNYENIYKQTFKGHRVINDELSLYNSNKITNHIKDGDINDIYS